MAEVLKPDFSNGSWASGGAIVTPSTPKVQTGWTAEVPPFQWENYLQNRQDNMLIHVNQHGIPVWDALTEYFANRSYVTGSDGVLYRSVAASSPSTTTQDPTTDTSRTYWSPAYADSLVNGVAGAYRNLKLTAVGTNAVATLTADEFIVKNAAGISRRLTALNISVNGATVGINGLDSGTLTANTWYYLYGIYNSTTNTVAGILSLNATAPTLSSGYTYYAYAGTVRVGATATRLLPLKRRGNETFYIPTPATDIPSDFSFVLNAGTATTFTALSLQAFFPPTATAGIMGGTHGAGTVAGQMVVAMGATGSPAGNLMQVNNNGTSTVRMQFEAPDPFNQPIYYGIVTNGSGTIVAMGWRE